MIEVPLTKGMKALIDDEEFELLLMYEWYATKKSNTWYPYTHIERKPVKMSRIILKITDPLILIDHKDLNGLNNQRFNLRIVNKSQNSTNRLKQLGEYSSEFKGVTKVKRRNNYYWKVSIQVNSENIHIGYFKEWEELQAAEAYDRAAIKYFGEYARLNFPKAENLVCQ